MYLMRIFSFILMTAVILEATEKITYMCLERAIVLYSNPKYVKIVHVSRRYSRSDPLYYLTTNITTYIWAGNNFTMHYFFYEFLTNTYKRSFVELHFGICDLMHKNRFFGHVIAQGRFAGPCPFPPGNYVVSNMTVPSTSIPKVVPFNKGRIYSNITFGSSPSDELVFSGRFDVELKQMRKKN